MYIKALSYVYMKALSREEGREEGGARGVEAQLLDVHRCERLGLQDDKVTSGGASWVSTGASKFLYWARPRCI